MAKKKMTKAQAASARKEVTQQDIARKQIREKNVAIRATQRRIQKEQGKSSMFMIIVGGIIVVAIIIFAWVMTIGPGMIVGS